MLEAQEDIKEEKERIRKERELSQKKQISDVDESFNSNVDVDEVVYDDGNHYSERPPSFHLAVSDIHEIEINKLRVRKYIMHAIMSVLALAVISAYFFYYTKACF